VVSGRPQWYAQILRSPNHFWLLLGEVLEQTVHERFYFNVPFMQKDRAKAMGMRFDSARKCWFAESEILAAIVPGSFPLIVGNLTQSQAR
jgi:hypothetical protein